MNKNKLLSLFQISSVGLLASTLVFSQAKPDAEMFPARASAVDDKGNVFENLKQEQFIVRERSLNKVNIHASKPVQFGVDRSFAISFY
ncbi:MAG TPA: hypothetical protein VGB00_09570 [Pyrinomonadaceae bacterium]|jgi:hypothetical protein